MPDTETTDRRAIGLAMLGVMAVLASGHSPYRQWYAYRAKHLIVVADKMRPGAFAVASAVASAIATRWPASKAVATRAETPIDVVKLVRSGQLPAALLPPVEARNALEGREPFADAGKVPLRAIAVLGDSVLVVLEEFERARAWDIAQALEEYAGKWPSGALPARGPSPIPLHPGALDYYESKP